MSRNKSAIVAASIAAVVVGTITTIQFARAVVVNAPASIVAVTPYRVLDTRDGTGRGGVTTPVTGGQTIDVAIAGVGPVPANAIGVVLNVTSTLATDPAFVTVWPTGETMPLASTLNLAPGVTSPNAAIALLGDGKVSMFLSGGSSHLIADVTGYLTSAAALPTTKTVDFPANSLGRESTLLTSSYGVTFPDYAGTGTTTGPEATLLLPRPTDWASNTPVTVSATFLNPGYSASGYLRFLLRPYSFDPPPESYANAGQITAPPLQMTQTYGTYTFTWSVPANQLAKATWSLRLARANNGANATYGGDAYNNPIDLLYVTVTYNTT